MATLNIHIDLATKAVIGASVDGKMLSGVASVNLGNRSVSINDKDGRDLLADVKNDVTAPGHSKAQLDIAKAFGLGEAAASNKS
jgi:hypothetical protein